MVLLNKFIKINSNELSENSETSIRFMIKPKVSLDNKKFMIIDFSSSNIYIFVNYKQFSIFYSHRNYL